MRSVLSDEQVLEFQKAAEAAGYGSDFSHGTGEEVEQYKKLASTFFLDCVQEIQKLRRQLQIHNSGYGAEPFPGAVFLSESRNTNEVLLVREVGEGFVSVLVLQEHGISRDVLQRTYFQSLYFVTDKQDATILLGRFVPFSDQEKVERYQDYCKAGYERHEKISPTTIPARQFA